MEYDFQEDKGKVQDKAPSRFVQLEKDGNVEMMPLTHSEGWDRADPGVGSAVRQSDPWSPIAPQQTTEVWNHFRDPEPWSSIDYASQAEQSSSPSRKRQYEPSVATSSFTYRSSSSKTTSATFATAKSRLSIQSATLEAVKEDGSLITVPEHISPNPSKGLTPYTALLSQKNLWPVDPMIEENWSGRGQHPEFATNEREVVNSILQVQDVLGSSSSAIVQSVRCRRILLARKTIRCIPGRTMTREKVIEEVVHLNRLKHANIVQLIGTYIIGQELSILMYPAADYNLEAFMEQCDSVDLSIAGSQFMICLSNAIHHLHLQLIKHMDIKPQNILVRFVSSWMDTVDWKVYLADFGISRSYKTLEATETEGPTMYTRKYAAPEVVDQDRRGLPADIFSLGCVFAELLARTTSLTTGKTSFERLQAVLCANEVGDKSYHANTGPVRDFLDSLIEVPDLPWVGFFMYGIFSRAECIALIKRMMDIDPKERPDAGYLVARLGTNDCCNEEPEGLEAASPPKGSV